MDYSRLGNLKDWRIFVRRRIGIGGNLAAPALPHHRTDGSRLRRFGGFSGASVLTPAGQAERGDVALGQRHRQRGALTQTPRAVG
jgi:hypothetical protein